MLSIGSLSKQTGVKIPTIRYYEQIGLIGPAERTEGNQRRYRKEALERLGFIKHARELGFSIETISSLIELNNHPDRNCAAATAIAREQLNHVRERIASLLRLGRLSWSESLMVVREPGRSAIVMCLLHWRITGIVKRNIPTRFRVEWKACVKTGSRCIARGN